MISFKQFLNESDDIESVIQQIQNDCAPFIKAMKNPIATGSYFFRGVKNRSIFGKNVNLINNEPEVVKGQLRTDRHPDSTPLVVHEVADAYFERTFGHKYRSNALFVTADENDADQYGKVYMVLPIGNYKCVTSHVINDLYLKIVPKGAKSLSGFLKTFISSNEDHAIEIVGKILVKNGLLNEKDLAEQQKVLNIFMSLFNLFNMIQKDDNADEKAAVEEIFNTYVFDKCKYFETKDAFNAMDTLNEVMLYCPDGWYGIEYTKAGSQLLKQIIQ